MEIPVQILGERDDFFFVGDFIALWARIPGWKDKQRDDGGFRRWGFARLVDVFRWQHIQSRD